MGDTTHTSGFTNWVYKYTKFHEQFRTIIRGRGEKKKECRYEVYGIGFKLGPCKFNLRNGLNLSWVRTCYQTSQPDPNPTQVV